MSKINIAVVGVGNCASSLIQGIHYYRDKNPQDAIGFMHWNIGGVGMRNRTHSGIAQV